MIAKQLAAVSQLQSAPGVCPYYGSHRELLLKALLATGHLAEPVLEMGMGRSSTRHLHDFCDAYSRRLVSVDSDPEWFAQFEDLRSECHELFLCNSCLTVLADDKRWSVALVDQNPAEERTVAIDKLKGRCGIIVIHDLGSIAPPIGVLRGLFAYVIEDPGTPGNPPSGAVSDTIDVTQWKLGVMD